MIDPVAAAELRARLTRHLKLREIAMWVTLTRIRRVQMKESQKARLEQRAREGGQGAVRRGS